MEGLSFSALDRQLLLQLYIGPRLERRRVEQEDKTERATAAGTSLQSTMYMGVQLGCFLGHADLSE